MYALVEIKGKQYKIQDGETLLVDRMSEKAGEKIQFDSVMMLTDGESPIFGTPYIEGASVTVEVGESVAGKKLRVFKYKRRKNYRRTYGHRQKYTRLKVEAISK